MISINKSVAVIALALIVGCSDKNSVDSTTINSIPEETSQAATQSSNPVAVDKSQTVDSKTNSQTILEKQIIHKLIHLKINLL